MYLYWYFINFVFAFKYFSKYLTQTEFGIYNYVVHAYQQLQYDFKNYLHNYMYVSKVTIHMHYSYIGYRLY